MLDLEAVGPEHHALCDRWAERDGSAGVAKQDGVRVGLSMQGNELRHHAGDLLWRKRGSGG